MEFGPVRDSKVIQYGMLCATMHDPLKEHQPLLQIFQIQVTLLIEPYIENTYCIQNKKPFVTIRIQPTIKPFIHL